MPNPLNPQRAITPQNTLVRSFAPGENRPDKAVMMSNEEVLDYQMAVLRKWQPKSEVYAVTKVEPFLSGMASMAGFIFTTYFRNRFSVYQHGRAVGLLASMGVPAFISITTHSSIKSQIMLGRVHCPVCTELKCGSLMVLCNVVQPFLLGLITSLHTSSLRHTTRLPAIGDFKEWGKFLVKHTRKIRTPFLGLVVVNFGAGMLLVRQEQKVAEKVWAKMGQ